MNDAFASQTEFPFCLLMNPFILGHQMESIAFKMVKTQLYLSLCLSLFLTVYVTPAFSIVLFEKDLLACKYDNVCAMPWEARRGIRSFGTGGTGSC